MKRLFNPSDKALTIWYGHTPITIGPNDFTEVEEAIAYEAVKVKGQEHLIIQDLGGEPIGEGLPNAEGDEGSEGQKVGEGDGEKEVEEPTPQPWDNPEWDPMTADIEVVRAYATEVGLKFDPDAPETSLRQNVDEHFFNK